MNEQEDIRMSAAKANLRMEDAVMRLLEAVADISVEPEYAYASSVGRVNVWAYRVERLVKSIEDETELLTIGNGN